MSSTSPNYLNSPQWFVSERDEIENGQNQSINNRLIVAMYLSVYGPINDSHGNLVNDMTAPSRKMTKDLWKEKLKDLTISTFMVLV